MANLNFKYGTTNINGANNVPGTIYVQKTGDGKAKMYIDTPTESSTRLQIGGTGDVYVGDPDDEEAKEYQAVINPNGNVIDNIVTSEEAGGYIIRVVESEDPDNYNIAADNPARNVITLVVQK